MAFAKLFSSPPGEVDFNALTSTHHNKSNQPCQNPKRLHETPRSTNPKKRKRKNHVSSGDARKGYEPGKDRRFHMVPFKYEEEHQKLSQSHINKETKIPLNPQSSLGPCSEGHQKNGQRFNERAHIGKNKMHRTNMNEDVHKHEEEHQKLSQCHINKETKIPLTPQSSLGPCSEGHQKNGQRFNERAHIGKNNMHRTNMNEDVHKHKRQGHDANRGKGCSFGNKKRAKMSKRNHQNDFNPRAEAGSKKGRKEWQKGRQKPQREERKPFMTPEFKEQNSIDVNGRLVCKHFLADRCLKGDQCQFEHSHDLGGFKFNGVCKFYVQGFCLRGDRCLFMHKTFPCKFFHTGRKCHHGDNCKFSHDALTELTKGLLDKLLEEQKVDRETLEPGIQEPEPKPDVDFVTNPVKLSFYSTAPAPEQPPACRFSFGAKDSEFTPESPASTVQAAPSTPLTAPPADTSPAQPGGPRATISSGVGDVKESFESVKTEMKPSTPLGPTPSVLSSLFTHLSPCWSDDEEEEQDLEMGCSQDAGTGAAARLCAKDVKVKEESGGHTKAPRVAPERLLTLKAQPDLLKEMKKEEEKREPPTAPLKQIPSSTLITPLKKVPSSTSSTPTAPLKQVPSSTPTAPLKKVPCSTPTAPLKQVPCSTLTARLKPVTSSTPIAPLKPVPRSTLTAPLKPVPRSTPIRKPLRSYRPLAVDISPLPLPFAAYHAQPPPSTSPQDVSSNALTPSVDSNSQSAVRRRNPLGPQAGISTTQAESQGRHSLPVQTPTWSVPSTHSASRSALRNRSLSSELDP
ncbi:zinc finger CCCH domain-containing protein 4-like [Sardina pilchardus]|uniref:zinc finger CCCH domain-containing protein 4-like n=1 Tax=Sardina pilchardus TaxID=27697 RepID=UPI002E0F5BB1